MIENFTEKEPVDGMIRILNKRNRRRQAWRILRLTFLTEAFEKYLNIELKRRLLESENTWKSAEQAKVLVALFFPGKETKTEDFIHDKNMLSDEIIDGYGEFKKFVSEYGPAFNIPEGAVMAFCKHEKENRQIFPLAEIDCIHYDVYLNNLFSYVTGEIGKEQLKNSIVMTFPFSLKKQSLNISRFRRSMIRAELLLEEMQRKMENREVKISGL
jgi:hypothetical protein